MIETALVYIHRIRPTKTFVGCGVLLAEDCIATCRHVWRAATAAYQSEADGQPMAEVEYTQFWQEDGTRVTVAASLADPCRSGRNAPDPDLVLLEPAAIPDDAIRLTPASDPRFETGSGYAFVGLPVRDASDRLSVQEVNVPGTIVPLLRSDRRRQFTGDNAGGYWTDRGSSGSPVFLGTGEQLAGIISLSETGRKSGESTIHEAFVVPGTIIRHHLSAYADVRRVAEREMIPAAELRPILDSIGAGDAPADQMAERLRMFVEGARARANQPMTLSNEGADIDAAIAAARDKVGRLDAPGALGLLQVRIEEEKQSHRRRLLPLLRERAAVERLAFDHAAAKATLAEITGLDPDATWDWIRLGDAWEITGPLAAALDAYGEAKAAAERLGDVRDLSASHERIGAVKLSQGDRAGALAAYTEAITIRGALAARDPANSDWQRDLSVSHTKIGAVKLSQGDRAGALAAYTEAMMISEALVSRNPANSNWQRDLLVDHTRIGDVKLSQGDRAGALAAYTEAMAALASRDPATDSDWQHDLLVSHTKIGDVKLSRGDHAGALAAYTEAMTISAALASRDPANSNWQRNLSGSHYRIGDMRLARGDRAGALAAYTEAMTISAALASRDPANSDWQQNLSACHTAIGDMRLAQGDRAGALAAYTEAMTISAALASRDPANSDWQLDLLAKHQRTGDMKVSQGDRVGALAAYTEALTISEALASLDPANSDWQHALSVSQERVGNMKAWAGDHTGALSIYRRVMAIREALTISDPANSRSQVDLIECCVAIAGVTPSQSRQMLARALEIARHLAEAGQLGPAEAWIPGDLAARLAALPADGTFVEPQVWRTQRRGMPPEPRT